MPCSTVEIANFLILFQLGYEYTIMEQADLMAAMMQTFRMKDVHLLSHDYGDSVAQELLARHVF